MEVHAMQISVTEAKSQLNELVRRAEAGDEIVLTRHGQPAVRLTPVKARLNPVAGVIGSRKLFYDVWGDTVNTAARMEQHGQAGRIQVSCEAREAIGDAYRFEQRGMVMIEGKGRMTLYFLAGRAEASAPANA
jgi:prevent-host-death family protein